MKTMKHLAILVCGFFSIFISIFLAGCGKQTINGAALPEFYGLFAIDGGKLVQIKQNEVPNYSENITFLFFDKNVAAAENITIYSIGFDTEPHPVDDGSFSWQKFAQAGEAYQRASQAAMTGIPEGAVPVETLKKPVPNKNEMLQFVPATPLKPGLYQFGNAVKFWVNKEKYQNTVESNARQELQTGHWVDASRFATIALLVGTSSPKLIDEMTQIKYGALSKGANEALKQENFDLAEKLAKRGNDLQPPSQFASEFNQLLNIEIPYQKAMKAATAASQQEDWDLLTRACKFALNLKPNDEKAVGLLSKSPKILLGGIHDIRFDQNSASQSVEILYLKFTTDGDKLFAGVGDHHLIGSMPYFRYDLIWNVPGKQFITPIETSLNAFTLDFSENLVAYTFEFNRDGIQLKDIKAGLDYNLPISAMDQYGLSQDGSIVWTSGSRWQRGDLSRYGLLSKAEAIGLTRNGNLFGNISGIIFWNSKTSGAISIAGFPDYQQMENIFIPSGSQMAVVCEHISRFAFSDAIEKYPDHLALWDISGPKLLTVFSSEPKHFLLLCAIRSDETTAIVYNGELKPAGIGSGMFETAKKGAEDTLMFNNGGNNGKFQFVNWSSRKVTHEVTAPSDVSFVVFSPNAKYVAYASQNDSMIHVAELDTWKIVYSFKEASGAKVTHLAFSPDGAYLAVALDRNKDSLALWKIPDDLKPLIAEKSVSPDNNLGSNSDVLKAISQVDAMEATASTNPDNISNLLALGSAYLQTHETNRAINLFDRALANPGIKYNEAGVIAQHFANMGNLAKLEPALQKLVALAPEQPEPRYDLAVLQAISGQTAEALQNLKTVFDQSTRRLANNPSARDLVAEARNDQRLATLRTLPEFQKLVPPK